MTKELLQKELEIKKAQLKSQVEQFNQTRQKVEEDLSALNTQILETNGAIKQIQELINKEK